MAVLADILELAWELEESSGSRVEAKLGSVNLTSNNSVGSTTGKVSNAAAFDGISKFLSHADHASLRMGPAHVTIGFWVKFNSLPANLSGYSLVTKDVDSPANSRDYTIDYFRNDATPADGGFRIYINGGGTVLLASGTSGFNTTGVWYYVLASHDPTSQILTLQINNGTVLTRATSGEAPQVSTAQFRVGARAYSGFENYADASIDQLMIFKGRPLTTYERAYLYNHASGQTVAALSAEESAPLEEIDLLPVRSVPNTEVVPYNLGPSWFAGQIYDPVPVDDEGDSSRIKVYVSGMSSPTPSGTERIGLFHVAKSDVTNPANWTEVGVVLGPSGSVGTPDRYHVRLGSVFWNPNASQYWMYYTGEEDAGDAGTGDSHICLATSADGITWARHGSNPLMSASGGDEQRVEEPDVIPPWVSGLSVWVMIYCRVVIGTTIQIRAATSPDGLVWTKLPGDILQPRADGATTYPQWHKTRKIGSRYVMVFEDGSLPAPSSDPYLGYVATSWDPRGPFVPVKFPTPFMPASGVSGTYDFYHNATQTLFPVNGVEYLFFCGTAAPTAYSGNWSLGVARCIDPTNLITVAEDSFTDANDTALTAHTMTTGAGWTNLAGTSKISSNKAVPNSDANDDSAVTDLGVSDFRLYAALTSRFDGATFDSAGLVLRATDTTHRWVVFVDGINQDLHLFEAAGGALTLRMSRDLTVVDGTPINAQVLVNGASITVYVDDEVKLVYNLAHTNTTATKAGLRLGKDGVPPGLCSWDDFVVQQLEEIPNVARVLGVGLAAGMQTLSGGLA